mmetsp:Transcript_3956/g.5338  ORF Transcript_3956/g.5338 Transcript_3956/m.5338 type:complete len:180 (-) Transcript_3956:135-674(-)
MLYFVLLKSFVTRCLSLKKGKLHMNTSALLVLKDCASRTIHLKASTKIIALAELCVTSTVPFVKLSLCDILAPAIVVALATSFVDTGQEILVPTRAFGAFLLKAPPISITLHIKTTLAMSVEELVGPRFARIAELAGHGAINRITQEFPFVIEIKIDGMHHEDRCCKGENGKDVLDLHG